MIDFLFSKLFKSRYFSFTYSCFVWTKILLLVFTAQQLKKFSRRQQSLARFLKHLYLFLLSFLIFHQVWQSTACYPATIFRVFQFYFFMKGQRKVTELSQEWIALNVFKHLCFYINFKGNLHNSANTVTLFSCFRYSQFLFTN